MSDHADTIRIFAHRYGTAEAAVGAIRALDALLAENQRLRDALERIAFAKGKPTPDPLWCMEVARTALAAVREENE